IAHARSDTEQLAATADFVHWAQTRTDGSRETVGEDPPPDARGGRRDWQDPPVAAARGERHGPVFRWRLARGTRGTGGSAGRATGGGLRAGCNGGSGAPSGGGAVPVCERPEATPDRG